MRKLFPFLLLCILVSPRSTLAADTVVEEIVARVNNEIITRGEYQRSREQLKQEAQQQDPGNADKIVTEKDKDVLRDLIDQQLLLEKGKDLGITADTDLIKKLDEMRKEMNLDTMEDLEKAAQAQGVSFEDFKQHMRDQIVTQQVIGKEVGSKMSISKEEEQQFYDAHKSELEQPEQIRLSEILVSTEKPAAEKKAAEVPAEATKAAESAADSAKTSEAPVGTDKPTPAPSDPEQQLAAAQAKAEDVLAQIRKGAAFADVAKKNSDGPTAAQGGDLGYFKRGTLAKELEEKTFAMKPGDVSDVIRTKQGFVILQVTEHQQAGIPPLNQIEPRIQDAIYMQKLQPALRAYLTKLREEAYIDIKPGYVDSGASANQTKPVETTAKETNAKELKKKKKKLGVI